MEFFWGIFEELLSKYDSVLAEHVTLIQKAQESFRLQIHCLLNRIQNEFIEICGSRVKMSIIDEIKSAK